MIAAREVKELSTTRVGSMQRGCACAWLWREKVHTGRRWKEEERRGAVASVPLRIGEWSRAIEPRCYRASEARQRQDFGSRLNTCIEATITCHVRCQVTCEDIWFLLSLIVGVAGRMRQRHAGQSGTSRCRCRASPLLFLSLPPAMTPNSSNQST